MKGLFLVIIFSLLLVKGYAIGKLGLPDHFFYVSYTYVDSCGVTKLGNVGWADTHSYPILNNLIFTAADKSHCSYRMVRITGISTIARSDYYGLFKSL